MRGHDLTPDQWAELYRQVFEVDKRGALILERMCVLFTQPAVTSGGIDGVLKTYHRLGQNSVLQHINANINRANGVPDTQENPE